MMTPRRLRSGGAAACAKPKGRFQVQRQHVAPGRLVYFFEGAAVERGGATHQHVKAPRPCDDVAHEPSRDPRLTQVRGERTRAPTRGADRAHCHPRTAVGTRVVNGHNGARP